jgi:hypothetical protein
MSERPWYYMLLLPVLVIKELPKEIVYLAKEPFRWWKFKKNGLPYTFYWWWD